MLKLHLVYCFIAQAIRRLSLDLKSEIDALMSATFTNASDIIDLLRLEKQMEKNSQHLNTVSQKLSTVSQKLETLEVENKNKRGTWIAFGINHGIALNMFSWKSNNNVSTIFKNPCLFFHYKW